MEDAPSDAGNRQQSANGLFIPLRNSLHWAGIPKIFLLLKFMDLSCKLSISELIALTHPGVSNVSRRGDERFISLKRDRLLRDTALTPQSACLVFHSLCSTYLCLYIH